MIVIGSGKSVDTNILLKLFNISISWRRMLCFDALILLFALSSSISLPHDVAGARNEVWLI